MNLSKELRKLVDDFKGGFTVKNKRALIILLSMLTILMFSGCSSDQRTASSTFYNTGDIYEIDSCEYGINVDKKTDNVYLVSTKDRSITPFYNKDGKISKYSVEANSLSTSNVNKERFYTTDEIYEIDRCDYIIVVDSQTDNCYLVGKRDRVIIPLYDKDGNIEKYSSHKK